MGYADGYLRYAEEEAKNGNNQKSVDFLNKCIEIDKVNTGAYYLRAKLNANMGKNEEACKDWSILASLGQVTAIKNLAKFCKN